MSKHLINILVIAWGSLVGFAALGADYDPASPAKLEIEQATSLPARTWYPIAGGSLTPAPGDWVGTSVIWDAGSGPLLVVTGGIREEGIYSGQFAQWDGAAWSAIGGSGFEGRISTLTVDHRGRLIAGGFFTYTGGIEPRSVAAWDGVSWSALGEADAVVYGLSKVIVDRDNHLIVSGDSARDSANLARWNGSSWAPIQGLEGDVKDLAIDQDGHLIAAGNFHVPGTSPLAVNVAVWDGDQWSALGYINGTVYTVEVAPNGDIFVGGLLILGNERTSIARWNGTEWSQLGVNSPNLDGSPYVDVYDIEITEDGKVYAAGRFNRVGDLVVNSIASWNGATWEALGADSVGFDNTLGTHSLLSSKDRGLVVTGQYSTAGNVAANNVARWDGTRWHSYGAGKEGSIEATAKDQTGRLYVGGNFSTREGVVAHNVAQWDGQAWSALGEGTNGSIGRMAVMDNGNLVVTGRFTRAGSIPANNVAVWDGQTWAALGEGVNNYIVGLGLGPQDTIVVGGEFTEAGGEPANRVAVWDGSQWSGLGEGFSFWSLDFHQQDGGDIYAGGDFWTLGPNFARHLARWNGSTWLPLVENNAGKERRIDSGYVSQIMGLPSGDLLVLGQFSFLNDPLSYTNLARWNGSSWTILGTGVAGGGNCCRYISGIVPEPDGAFLISGRFKEISGASYAGIASLKDGVWSPMGQGMERGVITTLEKFDDGEIVAGGYFKVADGRPIANLAVLDIERPTSIIVLRPILYPSSTTVRFSALIDGITAPVGGHVTFSISPGGACTDTTLEPIDSQHSLAICELTFNRPGPMTIKASYSGSTIPERLLPSQSSNFQWDLPPPVLFANGFE